MMLRRHAMPTLLPMLLPLIYLRLPLLLAATRMRHAADYVMLPL